MIMLFPREHLVSLRPWKMSRVKEQKKKTKKKKKNSKKKKSERKRSWSEERMMSWRNKKKKERKKEEVTMQSSNTVPHPCSPFPSYLLLYLLPLPSPRPSYCPFVQLEATVVNNSQAGLLQLIVPLYDEGSWEVEWHGISCEAGVLLVIRGTKLTRYSLPLTWRRGWRGGKGREVMLRWVYVEIGSLW